MNIVIVETAEGQGRHVRLIKAKNEEQAQHEVGGEKIVQFIDLSGVEAKYPALKKVESFLGTFGKAFDAEKVIEEILTELYRATLAKRDAGVGAVTKQLQAVTQ